MKILCLVLIVMLTSCFYNKTQSVILNLTWKNQKSDIIDIEKIINNEYQSVVVDSEFIESGITISFIEPMEENFIFYDNLLNKVYGISSEGHSIFQFDLQIEGEQFSAFSMSYSIKNGLIYILDAKKNAVIGMSKNGVPKVKFNVGFAPLHLLCKNERIFYYNPIPRNEYSNKYILTSSDLSGQNVIGLARNKDHELSKSKHIDIAWFFEYDNKIVMYNRGHQQLIEYDLENGELKKTCFDNRKLDIDIMNIFPIIHSQNLGFIMGKENDLLTHLVFNMTDCGITRIQPLKKLPRFYWGINTENQTLPFFPFDIMSDGRLVRINRNGNRVLENLSGDSVPKSTNINKTIIQIL